MKRVVADLSLDKHILTEALRKKSEAHTAPRAGRLGLDDLRCQLRAGLSFGAVQSSGVCAISRIRAQISVREQSREPVPGAG